MIDITYNSLRDTGAIPFWFGLGFVQLKINQKQRVHFWHPDCSPNIPEEEIHNHRYSFCSRIIVGEMIHETWTYEQHDKGKMECVEVSCQPGHSGEQRLLSTGNVTLSGRYTLTTGAKYFFPSSGFHRTITKRAVAFLCRGEIESDNAMVLRPVGNPAVCPFSVQKSEGECWNIIKELLS